MQHQAQGHGLCAGLVLEKDSGQKTGHGTNVFHAMRAVLAYDEIDMKKHSGVIAEFRRLYVKTGVFDGDMSKTISVLFDVRTESDYDDFFIISKEDVIQQAESAQHFLSKK